MGICCLSKFSNLEINLPLNFSVHVVVVNTASGAHDFCNSLKKQPVVSFDGGKSFLFKLLIKHNQCTNSVI